MSSKELPIFGLSKNASLLETSKKHSKNFMKSNSIPTAEFQTFTDSTKAIDYINKIGHEVVVKADGLASGKGVFVTNNKREAIEAVELLLNKQMFGKSSEEIIIEKKITGR